MSAAAPSDNEESVPLSVVGQITLTDRLAIAEEENANLKKDNDRLRERAAAAEALKREHERDDEANIIFMGNLAACKTARDRKEMFDQRDRELLRIKKSLSSRNDDDAPRAPPPSSPSSSGRRRTPDDDDDDDEEELYGMRDVRRTESTDEDEDDEDEDQWGRSRDQDRDEVGSDSDSEEEEEENELPLQTPLPTRGADARLKKEGIKPPGKMLSSVLEEWGEDDSNNKRSLDPRVVDAECPAGAPLFGPQVSGLLKRTTRRIRRRAGGRRRSRRRRRPRRRPSAAPR